jgi:hypothetical protein
VLGAYPAAHPFTGDLHDAATAMSADFPAPLPQLIAATDSANVQRWVLRDRKPLKQWSKGRATIIGDAAHPASPYAAYGEAGWRPKTVTSSADSSQVAHGLQSARRVQGTSADRP